MSDLLKLADRCEAATGPDRELDGSIWWAALPLEEIERIDRSGFIRECIERDGSAGKALAQFYDSSNPACLAIVAFQQAYTASLDAAMTLVPEGWRIVRLSESEPDSPPEELASQPWCALLKLPGDDMRAKWGTAYAATLPLALCAAALRARAAQ